jgi:alcohol-forming fatty acyl-CoA reductase
MTSTQGAAFFDVDGTLLKSTIVHHYFYLAQQDQPTWKRGLLLARLLSWVPFYLWLDRVSRDAFNHVFYFNYAGLAVEDCRSLGQRYFQQKLRPGLFPAALAQIAFHQSQGHRIVLVTGSVDCVIAPLAEFLGADSLTAELEVQNGCYTGALRGEPLADQEKARLIRRYAATHQLDLAQSFAYGDSMADLPMLQTVGHPVAVNPSSRLQKVAAQAGWPIKTWVTSPQPSQLIPQPASQPASQSSEPCL